MDWLIFIQLIVSRETENEITTAGRKTPSDVVRHVAVARANWWKLLWCLATVEKSCCTCSVTTGRTGRADQRWGNAETRSRFKDAPAKQSSGRTGFRLESSNTFSKFISHFVWKKKKDQDINFHLNSSRVCVPSSSPAVFRHVYLSLVWHCPADLSANLTCLASFLFSSVNSAHLIWQCWAFAPFALDLLFFTKDNHLSSAPLLPYSFGSVPEAAS